MSNLSGSQPDSAGAPPHWYPDPAGTGRLRWWNGHAWTEHYVPAPVAPQAGLPNEAAAPPYWTPQPGYGGHYPAAAPELPFAPVAHAPRPRIPRPKLNGGTSTDTAMIWLIALLPLVLSAAEFFWHPSVSFVYIGEPGQKAPIPDPAGAFTTAGALSLVSWAIYAASVVLAYYDWRRLGRIGVVRPFPWAWAFLGGVYIIGRSVIVRQVSGARSLAPLWAWIVVTAFGLFVAIVKVVELVAAVTGSPLPNA